MVSVSLWAIQDIAQPIRTKIKTVWSTNRLIPLQQIFQELTWYNSMFNSMVFGSDVGPTSYVHLGNLLNSWSFHFLLEKLQIMALIPGHHKKSTQVFSRAPSLMVSSKQQLSLDCKLCEGRAHLIYQATHTGFLVTPCWTPVFKLQPACLTLPICHPCFIFVFITINCMHSFIICLFIIQKEFLWFYLLPYPKCLKTGSTTWQVR